MDLAIERNKFLLRHTIPGCLRFPQVHLVPSKELFFQTVVRQSTRKHGLAIALLDKSARAKRRCRLPCASRSSRSWLAHFGALSEARAVVNTLLRRRSIHHESPVVWDRLQPGRGARRITGHARGARSRPTSTGRAWPGTAREHSRQDRRFPRPWSTRSFPPACTRGPRLGAIFITHSLPRSPGSSAWAFFVSGKVRSIATLDSAQTGDPNRAITPDAGAGCASFMARNQRGGGVLLYLAAVRRAPGHRGRDRLRLWRFLAAENPGQIAARGPGLRAGHAHDDMGQHPLAVRPCEL